MLWQIIFLAAGILSLIYYSAICIALKKWDSTFSRFWLAAGIVGIAALPDRSACDRYSDSKA